VTAVKPRETGPLRVSEPAENVLQVTFCRPERRNALTPELLADFRDVLRAAADDAELRAVVLTGAEGAFCAGFDLDAIEATGSLGLPDLLRQQEGWAEAAAMLAELPMPVVAAVDGPAVGAGMSLALAADVRVATERARFAAAFVRVGLSGADLGLSWTLPRAVGMGLAAELMLTGRAVSGVEAHRFGLVNRLAAPSELLAVALALTAEITRNTAFGVRLTKQVLRSNVDAPSMRAAMELENRNQLLASRTPEAAEALTAVRGGR
jgi:enoyl-CoA hydratase